MHALLIGTCVVALAGSAMVLGGCEKKSETEKALDNAARKTEDAAKKAGEAAEDAAKKVEDAVDDTAKKLDSN